MKLEFDHYKGLKRATETNSVEKSSPPLSAASCQPPKPPCQQAGQPPKQVPQSGDPLRKPRWKNALIMLDVKATVNTTIVIRPKHVILMNPRLFVSTVRMNLTVRTR